MKVPDMLRCTARPSSRLFLLLLLFGILAPAAVADELRMKDGQTFAGTILGTDGRTITLRMTIGAGQAEVPYPLTNIQEAIFTNTPEETALLTSGDPKALPEVLERWERRKPFLTIPGSDAGAWALQAARLSLARKTKKAAEQALLWAAEVEKADWSPERRSEATRLRLSALAAVGKAEQAIAEAEKMQNASGIDESALAAARVQARLVQATVAAAKLAELEKDWPKWDQMPEKRRERTALLNAALDGFLFAPTFHPELTALAAEGLWKAAEVAEKAGRTAEALTWMKEIVAYFPEPVFKSRAEERIRVLEKNLQPPKEKRT
jgi:hypothetical protein